MILLSDLLNEAYYGKSKNLEKCEGLIEVIKENILKKKNVNELDENEELCRTLEKEFGFKNIHISWLYAGSPNACTFPISLILNSFDEKLEKTDAGITVENSKSTLIIIMYYELFTIAELSATEALAILLHEIGHNFQHRARIASAEYYMRSVNFLTESVVLFLTTMNPKALIQYALYGTNKGRDVIAAASKSKINFILSKISSFFTRIIMNISSLFKLMPLRGIMLGIALLPFAGLKIIISWVNKLFGSMGDLNYFGEKYSDNFATSYGYGAELMAALKKLETKKFGVAKAINKSPFLRNYSDFISLPLRFVNLILDPHPSTIFRVKDQVKMLESELSKSDLSKATRKAISDDLTNARKELDEFEDKAKSVQTFGKVGTLFNAFLIKAYGGDPKEVVDPTKTYDYDEA